MSHIPAVITLSKLCFVTQEKGKIKTDIVKIDQPAACKQSNAPGQLRSFDSFEDFCKAGRLAGEGFRAAFQAAR